MNISSNSSTAIPVVTSMVTFHTSVASFQDVLESMANYKASLVMWRYCSPVVLVLGTVGNLMTLWVLSMSSASPSSSIPVFFRALAVSDLTLLYTGLLRNWIKYAFDMEIRDTHSAVCKIHIWLVYVTGVTSAWFLVMMTTHRALSVVWPHKMRPLRSRRTAFVTVAVVVVFSCLLNAHNLYGYDLLYYPDYGQYYCDYLNPDYESFARGPWPWIDLSFSSLLPFSFLMASNSLLMWKVTVSIRDVKRLTNTGRTSQEAVSQRQKMSTSLNLTLIFLSATFFLLTSPISVYLILDYYFRFDLRGDGDTELMAAANLGWAVTNILWYTNSAVNFYLYCLSGSRFRQQVLECLCCKESTERKKHMIGSGTTDQVRHTKMSGTSESHQM